ncbi:hypothetical protein [Pseudomonas putida]|uniref:Uncharacterized protein n=1 Tax=Pseudomonas putida TaxID=303 RepID=A0A8I1EAV6_PSEPU|nr:hypothetical protein [Pseudomonas putida]MBI6882350.1 hypothetical protein [Pseudomonas putida]
MKTVAEAARQSHLLALMVQPESCRGVYPYFDRRTVDFTRLKEYLYSISRKPSSINIMISNSYIDQMDMALIALTNYKDCGLRQHFENIMESARLSDFNEELFQPKPWAPLSIRYKFMKDSAPGVIPVIVNELEERGLMRWCMDLCKKFGISPFYAMDLFPNIGREPNPRNTTGSMDREMNSILTDTFNIKFDDGIVLIRADV